MGFCVKVHVVVTKNSLSCFIRVNFEIREDQTVAASDSDMPSYFRSLSNLQSLSETPVLTIGTDLSDNQHLTVTIGSNHPEKLLRVMSPGGVSPAGSRDIF